MKLLLEVLFLKVKFKIVLKIVGKKVIFIVYLKIEFCYWGQNLKRKKKVFYLFENDMLWGIFWVDGQKNEYMDGWI